jgi:hypothetical protein
MTYSPDITQLTAKTHHVSNEIFLKAVFGPDWERAHVTGFAEDPGTLDTSGLRHYWGGGEYRHLGKKFQKGWNTFFTISIFEPDPLSGLSRRRKVQFEKCKCIVLDDVNVRGVPDEDTSAKVPGGKIKLSPSWVLETSPNNFQVGYILDGDGDARGGKVTALLDALVASGLVSDGSDPGMKGVTRYVRLPVGTNTKQKYGSQGFLHNLSAWFPEKTYPLEAIADAYGIRAELDAADDDIGAKTAGLVDPDGDWIVEALQASGTLQSYDDLNKRWHCDCPFIEDHTGRENSGSVYLGAGRWACAHGHCQHRDHAEFTEKLRANHGEACDAAIRGLWDEVPGAEEADEDWEGIAPSAREKILRDLFGEEAVGAHMDEEEVKKELGPFQKRMSAGTFWSGDVWSKDPLTLQPALWKGVIPAIGYGTTYGPPGTGKSFLAADMLLRGARGMDWNGVRYKGPGPGESAWIYVASEGSVQANMLRLRGWMEEWGRSDNVLTYVGSFGWGKGGIDDPELFVKWARRETLGRKVGMVVVDTLNRNMAGGAENDTDGMTQFNACIDVIWRGLECAANVIHHSGKDISKGMRGSSVLLGAADSVIRVAREIGSSTGSITIEKNRAGEDGMSYGFELKDHAFGVDSDGDQVITKVVFPAKVPTAAVTYTFGARELALIDVYSRMGSGLISASDLCIETSRLIDEGEFPMVRDMSSPKTASLTKHISPSQLKSSLSTLAKKGYYFDKEGDEFAQIETET